MIQRIDLISDEYLGLQEKLHQRGYGEKGGKWAPAAIGLWREYGGTLLDYGCGRGQLARDALAQCPEMTIREYDPAIEGKNDLPNPADILFSTDVVEHIEPGRLDRVLEHMFSLADVALFVVAHCREANKVLADGRNAHLIVRPGEWWYKKTRKIGGPDFDFLGNAYMRPEKGETEWTGLFVRKHRFLQHMRGAA